MNLKLLSLLYVFIPFALSASPDCGDPACPSAPVPAHDPACTEDHDHDAELAGEAAHDPNCKEDHEKDEHTEKKPDPSEISSEALKNYGVTFSQLTPVDYTPYTTIPAQVEKYPGSEYVFTMPLGGQIQKINIRPGEAIQPGQSLVQIIRAPIPRPALQFTGNFLQPEVKLLRETASDFAKTSQTLRGSERELKRLEEVQQETDAGSLIPKKEIIELRNTVGEQRSITLGFRHSLIAFGYSDTDLILLERGQFIIPKPANWIAALRINGYWDDTAQKIFDLLPADVRNHYWSIACIGELQAMGLLTDAVLKAVKESEPLRNGWTDAASLLIQGNGVEAITLWADEGWMNQTVKVSLPVKREESGWDVESITVKNGQQLAPGAEILTVVNHEKMVLTAQPLGSELRFINDALVNEMKLEAVPVIRGTGDIIRNLSLASFTAGMDNTDNTAVIPVQNSLLKPHVLGSQSPRLWQLREGMKYLLRIPEGKTLKDVYVVPNGAVTDYGSDKIIIIKHGNHYETRKVVILRQDGELTILSATPELKAGETFAASGAFRLNLALQRGGPTATDPHAGCSH